jgi:phosphoribosylanthranilate isomerase
MMVKICGITNVGDALAAAEGGATALGFNFWPRSPRHVTAEAAARIIERLPATVWKVGVFVDENSATVARMANEAGLDIVQLHGHEKADDFPEKLRVWKAVRIRKDFDLATLETYPAEAILLDGPANGVSFDWKVAALGAKKVIIAGGLDAENVQTAIRQARPWGVDACSRIESAPGKKDHVKMAQFLKAALGS